MRRRDALRCIAGGAIAGLGACAGGGNSDALVLYSSVDDYLLREVLADLRTRTGLRVRVLGDTELTKTTGLVERLLREGPQTACDVWWSSEPFGTIRLAREGLLEPIDVDVRLADGSAWPMRGQDGLWMGFAQRARVIAYAPERVDRPPSSLAELTDDRWRGRVGIARPQFGTTRGHMGALVHLWGEDVFDRWLRALADGHVRVLEGNAAVVGEIARGSIDVGLTDSDDVFSARAQGLSVGLAFERREQARVGEAFATGAMLMPNTVARVRGSAPGSRELVAAILSERTERLMMQSDSHNYPVRPSLQGEVGVATPDAVMEVDLERVSDAIPRAMAICERVLG